MHHGAVMEGSWGAEATMVADADAALELLRSELRAGDVVLVKASNAVGLGALADALAASEAWDGNLKLVQRMLNHADIRHTLRYAHVLDEEVADGFERVAKRRKNDRTVVRKVV